MAGGHASTGLKVPLVSDLPKRSASDASSSNGASAVASAESGPYHILLLHKSRRPARLRTLTVTALAALCMLLLVRSDGTRFLTVLTVLAP